MNKRGMTKTRIEGDIENPLDAYVLQTAPRLIPFGQRTVSVLSLLLVLPLLYFYQIYNNLAALLCLVLIYIFDVLEDNHERKHNDNAQTDHIDHMKDIMLFMVIHLFILMRLYYFASVTSFVTILLVTVSLLYLMQVHFINLERYAATNHKNRAKKSAILRLTRRFQSRVYPNLSVKITRWFGLGTFVLWTCCVLLYSNIRTF